MSLLSKEQTERYHAEGYLVVSDLLTRAEIDAFLAYQSAQKPPSGGNELLMHTLDPEWRQLATHPRVVGVAAELLGGKPRVVQTMFLEKRPGGSPGFALHQDTHYIPNEPNTLMACWIAMDDTDAENGGLCVVPGSHRVLRTWHHVQSSEEHVAGWTQEYSMRDRDGKEWTERFYTYETDDVKPDDIVKLAVPKGSAVLFTGRTIHGSYVNRSASRPRRAWAVHYVREGTWVSRMDIQNTMPTF